MSLIIAYFKFVGRNIAKMFEWAVSLPGLIITLITTIVTSILSVWSFLVSHISQVTDLTTQVHQVVTQAQQVFTPVIENSYFQMLSYCLSLHLAWTYISTLVLLCFAFFGFIFFTMLVGFSFTPIVVFTIKGIKQIVALASLGFSHI